jgi:hypothetical protein
MLKTERSLKESYATADHVDGNFNAEGLKVLIVLASGRNGERRLLTRIEPEYPKTLKQFASAGPCVWR